MILSTEGIDVLKVNSILTKAELQEFKEMYLKDIASFYPLSSEYSADSYINAHLGSLSQKVSTVNRIIWKAVIKGENVGYTVVTEKDGKAIKFGPTIIKQNYRGKGIAGRFRTHVESIYASSGYLFSYSTTNDFSDAVLKYNAKTDCLPIFTLKNHFQLGVSEVILSKEIASTKGLGGYKKQSWEYLEFTDIYDIKNFDDFLDFQNLDKISEPIKRESEILNRKNIPISYKENSVLLLPKKGNSVQIIPIRIKSSSTEIAELLDICVRTVSRLFGRVYVYIPTISPFVNLFREHGFEVDGEFKKVIRDSVVGISVLSIKA